MAKPIEKIKQGLKLKAEPKPGTLTLRLGVKKLVLPFEPRLIQGGEFVFVHLTPNAEIFKVTGEGLELVESGADADAAVAAFRKPRGPRGRKAKAASAKDEIPAEVQELLTKIPAGFKIAYNKDGSAKIVKARRKRSKA